MGLDYKLSPFGIVCTELRKHPFNVPKFQNLLFYVSKNLLKRYPVIPAIFSCDFSGDHHFFRRLFRQPKTHFLNAAGPRSEVVKNQNPKVVDTDQKWRTRTQIRSSGHRTTAGTDTNAAAGDTLRMVVAGEKGMEWRKREREMVVAGEDEVAGMVVTGW